MMKRFFSMLVVLFILFAVTASAEPRYILPNGWSYNSEGKVVGHDGTIYESIYDLDCRDALAVYDWGYADDKYMEEHFRIDGNTAEMGDNRVSIVLLAGVAAISLAGFFYAGRKAHHAK